MYKKYLKYFVLVLLTGIPIFAYLNNLSLRVWDESRIANNAYEMYKNGNYVVAFYDGLPDMWNTKPPFLLWCQVFSMKLLGVNVLALRLPVALAALFTCTAVFIFSKKYLHNVLLGFTAVLVLVTSVGYISTHGARTGEYDVLVTLFTTVSCLFYFLFLERGNKKYLYAFFIATILAVLTKSVTGLLFIPALGLYTILVGRVKFVLTNIHLYIGFLIAVVVVGGFYFLREQMNPGYLTAVYENELGGRYNEAKENISGNGFYYIENLKNFRFKAWYIFAMLGLVLGYVSINPRIKKLALLLALLIVSYLFIISKAETKHDWYDMPLYPFLALATAIFMWKAVTFLRTFDVNKMGIRWNILPYLFLIALFFVPYQNMINSIQRLEPKAFRDSHQLSYYLKDALKGEHKMQDVAVLYSGYNAHIKFYVLALHEKGIEAKIKNFKELKEGDIVIANQKVVQNYLEENYKLTGISAYDNELYSTVKKYRIDGRK